MKIFVDLSLSHAVYPRESARIVLIAESMRRLGHKVTYGPREAVARCINHSPVGNYYMPLVGKHASHSFAAHDVAMYSAEVTDRYNDKKCKKVCIKTRYGNHDDINIAKRCDVYVSIEPGLFNRRNVEHYAAIPDDIKKREMSVPHMAHPRVWQWMMNKGLLENYVTNDLEPIRKAARNKDDKTYPAGFIGTGRNKRLAMIKQLPSWVKCIVTGDEIVADDKPLRPAEYLAFLTSCGMSICLPGCRPKTYRFVESVLFGVPAVVVGYPHIEHPIDGLAIILEDWADQKGMMEFWRDIPLTRQSLADDATEAYIDHWSPAGQAADILRRLGV